MSALMSATFRSLLKRQTAKQYAPQDSVSSAFVPLYADAVLFDATPSAAPDGAVFSDDPPSGAEE